jgi:uncharacterized protein (TIGR02271 family)
MKDEGMDRVVPLSQAGDFEVAEGEPDIRGWEVRSSDGRTIGRVDELLVDTGALKVRYLDVEGERGLVARDGGHFLVPVGFARLDAGGHRVTVDSLASSELRNLPPYDRQPLTRDFLDSVDARFHGAGTRPPAVSASGEATRRVDRADRGDIRRAEKGDARLTLSEEELSFDKRQVQAGEVDIDKRVETRHVHESVPVRREEVTVERRPINDPRSAGTTRIENDEVRIPLREEEVVVEKRVVPREELVVKKREVVEERPIEADLRRERLDVHEEGDAHLRRDRPDDRRPS